MSIEIKTIPTEGFDGQLPGTSGLRKKTKVFKQPGYLESYIQSIFNAVTPASGASLVLGGDGRHYNRTALATIVQIAVANGYKRLIIGRDGILSTPAASNLIRIRKASGGIILSASHNPGGPDGDFGVKYNGSNGAAVPTAITERFYEQSQQIREYRIATGVEVNIGEIGETRIGDCTIEVVDPVADYAALMESFFDFDTIESFLTRSKFRICFDAMNAVSGPYAKDILEGRLGAQPGSVINATPLEDFGGLHPDPNPIHAHELYEMMNGNDPADFGAASDGDGDRNMVLATGLTINPCDSLAIMLNHAEKVPGFKGVVRGVARSMPTSRAVDRVAKRLGVPCYETPTGWKYFGSLLDADMISLCGEESFGTGSMHTREKDGLWSVIYWLDLIACIGQPPSAILRSHWASFGRDYFQRHDYENISPDVAEAIYEGLRSRLGSLPGQQFNGLSVASADDFCYTDPVDGSVAKNQGLRVEFENGARIVMRSSGTGTEGATLRLYFDQYEDAPAMLQVKTQKELATLIGASEEITSIASLSGRKEPDAII